ncbi:MAG: OsmC family protein [Candidatus Omnitrophota bacterium]
MQVRADIRFAGDDLFEVKTTPTEVAFHIDKKKENKVALGPNSLELFISSLGGCLGVYAERYLRRHEIEFKILKISVDAELSSDTPTRLVNIKINLFTDAQLRDKKDVFLRFIKNCPVHNTVLHTKEVNIVLNQD